MSNTGKDANTVTTVADLERIYGTVKDVSRQKETGRLTPAYRALIEASPFAVLATSGPGGLDCSPRGDAAGFVSIHDDTTLLLPDRRGNNRLDSLRNIVVDPRVALLFLIPGNGETLRVNGRAQISTAPDLLQRFAVDGKTPATTLVVRIEAVYFQCARAILRSRLWSADAQTRADPLPSAGDMLRDSMTDFDGASYDANLSARQRSTLY